MSLNITAIDIKIMELTLSANSISGISWYPYIIKDTSEGIAYTASYESATASYPFQPSTTFNWGTSSALASTNIISVTAFSDTVGLGFSATYGSVNNTNNVEFYPYYLDQVIVSSAQLSASVSSFFVQTSTRNFLTIPEDRTIIWDVAPNHENAFGIINSPDYDWQDLNVVTYVSGFSPEARQINFAYTGSGKEVEFYTTTRLMDYRNSVLSGYFTFYEPQSRIILNPLIKINNEENYPFYALLSAVYNNILVPDNISLIWDISDSTNTIGLTGNSLDSIYTFGEEASSLSRIKISATDLTNIYTYYLSSYTGQVSGTFRPYDIISDTSLLDVRITKLSAENSVYRYILQGLGNTNGHNHLLSPYQFICWNSDNIQNASMIYADGITPYNFETPILSVNSDNIYLQIIPELVSTAPKTCSIGFQLCALSSSNISDGIIQTYNFNIVFNEWLNEEAFNPKFRFQYEAENVNTIYRPITSSAIYNISNTSILPQDSIGYITYTFNNGVCTIPFDVRNNNPAPSGITYEFSSLTERVCTITMTVCASAVGYEDYVVRNAFNKNIIFADIPAISGFKVYPQYMWNGTDWEAVVSNTGEVLTPTAYLSAYGLCHTENFFVSSDILSANAWRWDIQDINNSNIYNTILLNSPTGWLTMKTGNSSSYMGISAAVFTNTLPADMPSRYYDTPNGIKFNNFADTFNGSITADNRQHIKIVGAQDLGTVAYIEDIKYRMLPAPNMIYLSGFYSSIDNSFPFTIFVNNFYFNLSSEFWNISESAKRISNNIASTEAYINVDEIGNSYLSVPRNETTPITIYPSIDYTLQLKKLHPLASDWCLTDNHYTNISNTETITAYPMTPLIYNANRFMASGLDVKFENMIQCFSGVNEITWYDRAGIYSVSSCAPYTTSFTNEGDYSIRLTNNYNYGDEQQTLNTLFNNIVSIQKEYLINNPDITRIFGEVTLKLPYDKNDCSIPPNEWMVADNFNASITKLQKNLTYLDNMSKLYDIPPTQYIGWFGTIYYGNSAKRTRWFTNTPYNSYSYDEPENALNTEYLDNLQSIYVRDNNMFISNGTSVSILSGDFWATPITRRTYKTLGDDFTNIRSVSLDSAGRIYLLDSYDSSDPNKGSKNRVLVFTFNYNTSDWQLSYEWGGLGGPNAKNKFNNPSDLYVDDNDIIWITDTDNKCIKKYTRTGSWLSTITSEYFTENEKPISMISDINNGLFVLTNSQLLKYTADGVFEQITNIEGGALKIQKCNDGGFVYIVYSNRIEKYTTFGIKAGAITFESENYTKLYRNVFHDEYRNLYIVCKNHVLKYVDQLSLVTLKPNTDSMMWPLHKMHVQKDEYIQDWVINRCFQRLWDNLEIFRRSLNGKFGYQTFKTTTITTVLSTITAPEDFDYCNYDWLGDRGISTEVETVYSYEKPIVRSFNIDEYKSLPYSKNMIYIGINELHSSEVYNRVISRLYECEQTLLRMIND